MHPENDKWVVKIAENKTDRKSNRIEWLAWQKLKGTIDAVLVAPCIEIASDNSWLVQVRAEPTDTAFDEETAAPWMGDYVKPDNCGMLDGRLVQVDYGCSFTAKNLGIDTGDC